MFNFNKHYITFLIGILFGSYLAFYLKSKQRLLQSVKNEQVFGLKLPSQLTTINTNYESWFKSQGYSRKQEELDSFRYEKNRHSEAQILEKEIRILCVILSNNIKTTRAGVKTWGQGCSNVTIVDLGYKNQVKHWRSLPIKNNAQNSSWNKLCELIKSVEYDLYKWIVLVHEQTFVIMENLRWFVASLDFVKGYYLGQAESFWGVKYNQAHAGIVLSQGSVRLLRAEFEQEAGCKVESLMLSKEDFTLGKILSKYDIFPIDTRDKDGYSTFNAFNWQQEFFPGVDYYKNAIFPRKCCSSRVITFKGIEEDKFYMYQYLLYNLGVFNDGSLGNIPMPTPKDKDIVWKQFLAEQGIYRNVSAEEYYNIWVESGLKPEMFNTFENNYD